MTPDLPPIHPCEWAVCQAGTDAAIAHQHAQINLFLSRLTEPQRRWYAGMLSQAPDGPSDRPLALITGLDPKTIARGRAELAAGLPALVPPRQRRPGGGRQPAEKKIRLEHRVAGPGIAPHGRGSDDEYQVVELPLMRSASRSGGTRACG